MALLTKPIETAIKNRDNALVEAEEWKAKAYNMRAAADTLDASANDAILEDETAAERITVEVNTMQRKARAFEQAATEARKKADTAAREVLRINAEQLDKEATKLLKSADAHDIEVSKAKAALESLDGCVYERLVEESDWDPVTSSYRTHTFYNGAAAGIRSDAKLLSTQSQVIRYWLEQGQLPGSLQDLNDAFEPIHDVEGSWAGGASISKYGDPITGNLREAIANSTGHEGK